MVLNSDDVPGVSESTLQWQLFQQRIVAPNSEILPILTVRQQVSLEMEIGLRKYIYGDEIELLGKLDCRGTWCLHAGITAIQGKAWNRKGGLGIARPGTMAGKVNMASTGLRHFAARLGYLLTHVFIMRVLSCSSREGQGNSSKVRRELAADWFEWLQANPYADIRLPEAVTFSFGNGATLHFDALNDPRFLFDQVTWAVHYVDQLSQYLLTDSLKALADGGVQTTNVAFTHLSYTRVIMGIVQVIDSNILPKSIVHYSNRSVLCSTTTASDCMTHPT